MGFFDIFKKKKQAQALRAQQSFKGPSIFYHEDDFRQVEILPDDNLALLSAESEKLDTYSEEHRDGPGFRNIVVRSDQNKIKLNQRNIDPKELEIILASLGLDRIPNVLTGYGQHYREKHMDCIAYGKGYRAVYYDFKDHAVEHIWFTNQWGMDRDKLGNCLHELGTQWNVLLQDWNLSVTVDLKNKSSIEQYLKIHDEE